MKSLACLVTLVIPADTRGINLGRLKRTKKVFLRKKDLKRNLAKERFFAIKEKIMEDF